MTLLDQTYRNKTVLITGETGFKGGWLAHWLLSLGARVHGISLAAEPDSIFEVSGLADRVSHSDLDIRNSEALAKTVKRINPDFVFHLAAQSLVRESYSTPRETFETNVSGTVNVLEALRERARPCVVVVVSSDKCYENREWPYAYREVDPMGGHDPYSASKGCVEIVTTSYNRAFLLDSEVRCASARAGNVIGAGDWANDRIVPDIMRAVGAGKTLAIRNPNSVRPWQHVLEPLSGYLVLAARMARDDGKKFRQPYNFGPRPESARDVRALVEMFAEFGKGSLRHEVKGGEKEHESRYLRLAIDKAVSDLGWAPVWSFEETARHTWQGYEHIRQQPEFAAAIIGKQIEEYLKSARALGLSWAE